MEQLDGRVAVVTGGASGIGLGVVRRLLSEGMKVVVADRDTAALDRAIAELSDRGEVLGHATDVADPASIEALAEAAVGRFGAVHLLMNNAGVGGFQSFDTTSRETWDWVLGVNLMGVIDGCRIFLPILRAQDEAHIVNTASVAGFVYTPYLHPYNVSKAGVVALTEGLYLELARECPHVGISVLCPGSTATNIDDDERNAPPGHRRRGDADPGLGALRDLVNATNAAGMSPAEMAEHVVRGIRRRSLHILSHPDWVRPLRDRVDAILDGRPVADPLGAAN
jgi:NAD(P)-dependent dehydrogenase (short-subunit alcohol dehydrogenase family)